MRPLYTKFSLVFLFSLLLLSNSPIAMVSSVDKDLTTKDKIKETTNPTKPRNEVGGKNDRPKKDETFPSPTKKKAKLSQRPPTILNEDIKTPSFTPFTLSSKGLQPIKTNFNKETNYNKIVGPDPFRFTITSNKDSIAIGEEIELTIAVDWVDFGVNNGVRFLPEWYKYTLRVVTPKGFTQTGGDYTDFCTKPVDANNPQAVFTIKGKFVYAPDEAKFTVLRGFEGADEKSEFIAKGEISIKNYKSKIIAKDKSSRKPPANFNNLDGCPNSLSVSETSRFGKVHTFSIDSGTWTDIEACLGGTVLTATWDFGDGTGTTTYQPSASHTYSDCETHLVSVTVNGLYATCISTILPLPTIRVINGNFAICNGGSSALTSEGCETGSLSWSSKTVSPTTDTDYSVDCTEGDSESGTSCTTTSTARIYVKSVTSTPTITSDAADGKLPCGTTTLTLTASGCSSGTKVWRKNGSVTGGNDATIDAEAGGYTLTCQNSGECVSSPSASFSVLATHTDTPSISGAGRIPCGATELTLTAVGCDSGTKVWSNDADVIGGNTSTINVGRGFYTLTCQNPDKCISKSSTSVSVLNAFDKVNISDITYDVASQTLYVTSTTIAAASFQWKKNGNSITSTTVNTDDLGYYKSTISLSGDGTYTVYLENVGYCNSDTKTYVKACTVTSTPTISGAGQIACGSGGRLLTSNCATGSSHSWLKESTTPGIYTQVSTDNGYSAGAGSYKLKCTETSKCQSLESAAVGVSDAPTTTSTPTISGAGQIACGSGSRLLTSNCASGASHSWLKESTTPEIYTQVSTDNEYSAGAGSYKLKCTETTKCQSLESAAVGVSDAPSTTSTPTISGAGQIACRSTSKLLTSNCATGASHSWLKESTTPGIYTQVSTDNGYSAGVGSYKLKCTETTKCQSLESAAVGVSDAPTPPDAPLITGDSQICPSASTTLTASACSNGSFLWSTGAITQDITASVGTYTVTCTKNGCTSGIGSKTITAKPVTSPTISPASASICSDGSQNFTINSGVCDAGTISWKSINTQNLVLGTGSTLTNRTDPTTYYVSCTNSGCTTGDFATLRKAPIISAQIFPNSPISVCEGSNLNLSALDNGIGTTYNWSSTGYTDSGLSVTRNFSAVASLAGTYNLNVSRTFDSNYNNITCSASTSATVNITSPSLGGSVSPSGTLNICESEGLPANTFALSGNRGTIIRWEKKLASATTWTNCGGTAASSCTFTSAGDWKIRAIVKNGVCSEVASTEGSVNVFADPSISISSNRTTICSGEFATLTAVKLGGTGTCTVTWQFRDTREALG